MDIFKLPNVVLASPERIQECYERTMARANLATLEEAKANTRIVAGNSTMMELVQQAVVKWPQWTFKIKSVGHHQSSRGDYFEIYFSEVEVYSEEGVHIGQIGADTRYTRYAGDEKVVRLHNSRIDKARERSRDYVTKDVKAALREMKKSFYAPTIAEIVEEADSIASRLLHTIKSKHERSVDTAARKLQNHTLLYLSGTEQRRERFGAWYQKTNRGSADAAMSMLKDFRSEYKHARTIEEVQHALRDDKTALIIKNQGGYILRIDKEVKLCDDSTLPENIKTKLGMLKLVEESQVISNVGARVNDETFLVVLDDEAQA